MGVQKEKKEKSGRISTEKGRFGGNIRLVKTARRISKAR